MSEKDRGFSFKSLFLRDAQTDSQENQNKNEQPTNVKIPQATAGVQDQSLVETFVQRLQNLINQNNQPGFDFLEFTESLFEEKQNPDAEVYKTVFRIAQKIDKSLTPSKLLDSSMTYKNLVQQTADAEIAKGESKKQGLQTDKDNEKNNLDNNLKDTRAKIQQLTKQIQDLQNQDVALSTQLSSLDQKYNSQFSEIDNKITAIRNAKEQVLVSIVDIEAGIKSNLS